MDSRGGGLMTVTEPLSGWFRYPGRVRSWNRDEDYDAVVMSEKGSYGIVGCKGAGLLVAVENAQVIDRSGKMRTHISCMRTHT